MLNITSIKDYYLPNYLINRSWLKVLIFYRNMQSYMKRIKAYKRRYRRKSFWPVNFKRKRNFWFKIYYNTPNHKSFAITGLGLFVQTRTRKGPKRSKKLKNINKLEVVRDLFLPYYANKVKSKYTFKTYSITNSILPIASPRLSLYKRMYLNWIVRFRKFRNKFKPKKIGLFNVFYGLRHNYYRNTTYKFRKKLYSSPDRNGPTWKVIRKIFRPREKYKINTNYSWSNEWMPSIRKKYQRRSFMPKLFFKNSLFMWIRKRRVAIDKYFNLRFIYQRRMNNFLFQFKLISMSGVIRIMGCTLEKIVNRSGMLIHFYNSEPFFRNGWIYLNGHIKTKGNFFVFKNDVISFFFNWHILRYLVWSFRRIKKNRYYLNRYYFLFIIKRRKRKTVQYWIEKYKEIKMRPLYYLERDFLTMTAFLLKDYDYRDFKLRHIYPTIPYGVLFNFNWKFIT